MKYFLPYQYTRMSQSSAIPALQCEVLSPKGIQEEEYLLSACISVIKLCPTLCEPMDCSLPGSSVHGILQARILEQVAFPFSRGLFLVQGSDLGLPHCIQILYHWSHQKSPKSESVSPKNCQALLSTISFDLGIGK